MNSPWTPRSHVQGFGKVLDMLKDMATRRTGSVLRRVSKPEPVTAKLSDVTLFTTE